jgi:endonuclease V-like protein UPF0215 family
MTSSFKEISKRWEMSSRVSKISQVGANQANEVINRLGTSSKEIGNIIKTTTS